MAQQTEQIVRRKLSDEVFARLKAMITSGELQPGDEMPSERELMERFGVGRPAIREAMQALAGMGLVVISHGERAKVLELTAQSIFRQMDMTAKIMLAKSSDSLEHLKNARIFFERGMAREAALKAKTDDIASLRDILEHQRDSLGNADAFISADMEFHTRIARISGNPIYVAVSEAMLAWLQEYHTDMLIWTGKEKFTLAEHEEIIACLEARDPDAAEQAVLKHLERSRALYTAK
ncbi:MULTISPECIES: transcriptional regulator NanR [unclassified Rhizobium]|uniref:transcriptional regulator NanR n=1 Tax=unclassified Rhizobium TaxID=2613769 RepID=UPI0007123B1D|nr:MULTISPECIES: transcriptional regulator NanR [unclassified Rhizobium]KQS82315.1 GntR family transcriptional regulator [Rhizobium sp. Leaf386]KQT02662.1 GntR family transcriptional regulator [Rhizobium sp. Leaf391]KQU03382.1 GntR family transcriptional regulator [Rhizobium sp. Leaf453]